MNFINVTVYQLFNVAMNCYINLLFNCYIKLWRITESNR